MSMDLYESDLSLFGGDLLAGLSSPVDTDTDLPELLQDGAYQLDVLKPAQTLAAQPLAEYELSSPLELESSFQSVEPAVSGGLFDNRWLDVNTDLLELLEASQPDELLIGDDLLVPLAPAHTQHGSTALQILQSMADDNQRVLSASPPAAEANASDNASHIAGSSVLMSMLLEGQGLDNNNSSSSIEAAAVSQDQADHDPLVLGNYMNVDVDEQLVLEASLAPLLSPVSPEDVESLLSSGPCSPCSAISAETMLPPASVSFEASSDVSEYVPDDESSTDETWLPSPPPRAARSKRQSTRSAPYATKSNSKSKPSKEAKQEERKLRKKQQNRDAALRYRHKKKEEGTTVESECDILEKRNHELKDQTDQLAREIKYLKDLMADVYRAKGLLKPKKK